MKNIVFLTFACLLIMACSSQKGALKEVQEKVTAKASIKKESFSIPGTEVSFQMALLPAGTVTLGSEAGDAMAQPDESPQVNVQVGSFWIGTHEVSFDEFIVYREKEMDKPSTEKPDWDADAITRPSPPYEDPTFGMGEEGFPAVSMTQFSALQYCKWLSDKTGEFYRLPSEAEWEYACKAGSDGHYYFENPDSLDAYSWHYDNSAERYHKIGSKKPNPWGLYDILGNVSEWTLDQYKEDAYAELASMASTEVNPWIKPTKLHPRTVRGGSWDDKPSKSRCTCRIESDRAWKERDPQIPKSYWWNTDSPFVGFRIVKPEPAPTAEEQEEFWMMVLGG